MLIKFLFTLCLCLSVSYSSYCQIVNRPIQLILYQLENDLSNGFPPEVGRIDSFIGSKGIVNVSENLQSSYYLFKASDFIFNEQIDSGDNMLEKALVNIRPEQTIRQAIYLLLKGGIERRRLNYKSAYQLYDSVQSILTSKVESEYWKMQLDVQIAFFYHQQSNFVQAMALFEQILKKNPEEIDALLGMALIHNDRLNFTQAEPYYKVLDRLSQKMLKRQFDVLYFLKCQYFRFHADMDSLIYYSEQAKNYNILGLMMFENKLYDSAKYYYTKNLKTYQFGKNGTTQKMKVLVSLAFVHLYSENVSELNKTLILLHDEYREYLYQDESYIRLAAEVAATKGNYDEAFNIYKTFINRDTVYIEPQLGIKMLNQLINIYPRLSNIEEALEFHEFFIRKIETSIQSKYSYDQAMIFENLNNLNTKFLEGNLKINSVRQQLVEEEEKARDLRLIVIWGSGGALLLILFLIYAYQSQKKITLLNKQLNKKAKILNTANKEKDMLLAVISHQIKAPLSNIIYFLDMSVQLVEDGNITELSKFLNSLHEAVKTSYKRAIDVLGWLNVTNQDNDSNEYVGIKSILDETLEFYKPMAAKRALVTKTNIEESSQFNINKDALKIIFQNLIENAVKYTQEGGGITITEENSNSGRRLNIENENDKSHVDSRYKPSDSTGMGLVIVKDLCDKFNITLSYQNTDLTTKVVLELI